MSNVGLQPVISPEEKRMLVDWLRTALSAPTLANPRRFPLNQRLGVYVNGTICIIYQGAWQMDGTNVIYLGGDSPRVEMGDRLAILGSLISLLDAWDALLEPFSTAISRSLLEQYNASMRGLIRSNRPATGLAFNPSAAQMAAQIDGKWFLPNGTEVTAMDTAWTVLG